MLDPSNANVNTIDAEFEINNQERAVLISFCKQEGWDLMQKIMESEIRRYNVALINTPEENEAEVLAKHKLTKGLASWYTAVMTRIAREAQIQNYNDSGVGTISNPENNNIEDFR